MSSYFSSFFSSLVSSGGVQAAEKPPAARPSHHAPDGKGFLNPWPSAGTPHGFSEIISMLFTLDRKRGAPPPENERVPVIPMDWEGILHFHDDHHHDHEPQKASEQQEASHAPHKEDADKKKIRATWLGHAAFLVQMEGCNILADPCCSERCSPFSFAGPKRIRPLPCELRELAPLTDAVIISHNHYDHLDLETIKALGPEVTYFVPLGNKAWFTDNFPNYSKVVECDWWDSVTLHKSRSSPSSSTSTQQQASSSSSSSSTTTTKATWTSSKRNLLLEENDDSGAASSGDVGQGDHHSLEFVCTPCQHFSGRSLTDRMQTLWSSWAIRSTTPASPGSTSRTSSFFFGGDTGYRAVPRGLVTTTTTVTTPTTTTTTTTTTAVVIEDAEAREQLPHCPAFKEIGDRLGPFDLACLPIGAYSPRWFMSQVHCDPLDAVHIHRDIRAKKSIGMHWGTFILTDEDPREPPLRLKEALRIVGRDPQEFVTLKIGESLEV